MALSVKTFCLVFGWLILCLFHYSSSSGSSGSEKEKQHCGSEKFYCPRKDQCFDRKLRCTASPVCVNSNGNEDGCFETASGTYKYYKKKTKLSTSGSSDKRKRSPDYRELKHWFVEYRGFVYEFGPYGFQELDVNDPKYKYGPGRKKVESEEYMGSSRCTRDHVLSFIDKWLRANPDYKVLDNNCQHFAHRLLDELKNNCPYGVRKQGDDTESLRAPSQCPEGAREQDDYEEESTITPSIQHVSSALRWKLHALRVFASLILFTILHNIIVN